MPRSSLLIWPRFAQALWRGLLGLVYPPCCLGCSARVADPARPLCPRCVLHLERADLEAVAAQLRRLPEAEGLFEDAFALWFFDKEGTLQRVQHALKYRNRPHYGMALGQMMGHAYRDAGLMQPGLVVPIPLHRARRYERGYNQSALLARGVAQALGVLVRSDVLRRPRPTASQTALSRRARWANVAGSFAVTHAAALRGRRVLLVDDVLTTGATATAAARVLRNAGASAVALATLALARG